VKERDIEAKLKLVENEWSAQRFQFSTFKTRGELLLKGMTSPAAINIRPVSSGTPVASAQLIVLLCLDQAIVSKVEIISSNINEY